MNIGTVAQASAEVYAGQYGASGGANAQPSSGGGGGYGGPISNEIKSGGTNRAAFGAVNFGAGAKVGGTTAEQGDAGTGFNSNLLLYGGIAIAALIALYLFIKR